MQEHKVPTAFPLKHSQQDMRLALELAHQHGQELPVAAASNGLYEQVRQLCVCCQLINCVPYQQSLIRLGNVCHQVNNNDANSHSRECLQLALAACSWTDVLLRTKIIITINMAAYLAYAVVVTEYAGQAAEQGR